MRESLYKYSDDELSLRVFNDECLYLNRHKKNFIRYIKTIYQCTNKQIAILKQDLIDDKTQIN